MDEGFNIFAGPETEQVDSMEPEWRPAGGDAGLSEAAVTAEHAPDRSDVLPAERDLFGGVDSAPPRRSVSGFAWRSHLRTLALGAAAIVVLALAGMLFGSGGRG